MKSIIDILVKQLSKLTFAANSSLEKKVREISVGAINGVNCVNFYGRSEWLCKKPCRRANNCSDSPTFDKRCTKYGKTGQKIETYWSKSNIKTWLYSMMVESSICLYRMNFQTENNNANCLFKNPHFYLPLRHSLIWGDTFWVNERALNVSVNKKWAYDEHIICEGVLWRLCHQLSKYMRVGDAHQTVERADSYTYLTSKLLLCEFLIWYVGILNHIVLEHGAQVHLSEINLIKKSRHSQKRNTVQSFLRTFGYCWRLICSFPSILATLQVLKSSKT